MGFQRLTFSELRYKFAFHLQAMLILYVMFFLALSSTGRQMQPLHVPCKSLVDPFNVMCSQDHIVCLQFDQFPALHHYVSAFYPFTLFASCGLTIHLRLLTSAFCVSIASSTNYSSVTKVMSLFILFESCWFCAFKALNLVLSLHTITTWLNKYLADFRFLVCLYADTLKCNM